MRPMCSLVEFDPISRIRSPPRLSLDAAHALPVFCWQTSDRLETLKMRSLASSTKSLRVLLHHRSSCTRARHLLQVYVTYWLTNGTGLTLQFKRRKQLAPEAGEEAEGPRLPGEVEGLNLGPSAEPPQPHGAGFRLEPEDCDDLQLDAPSIPNGTSLLDTSSLHEGAGGGGALDEAADGDSPPLLAAPDGDNQTLLYSVPKGSKHQLTVCACGRRTIVRRLPAPVFSHRQLCLEIDGHAIAPIGRCASCLTSRRPPTCGSSHTRRVAASPAVVAAGRPRFRCCPGWR